MSSDGFRCSPRGFRCQFLIPNGPGILPTAAPGPGASCRTCQGSPPRTRVRSTHPARQSRSAVFSAPAHAGPPVWLHGDLHPANILVHGGQVSGVIDFGDLTSGDPAVDLAVAWMLLPAELHGAFREAYRAAGAADPADGALWQRARGWALNFALVFLAFSAA
jgi:aminoglycoside phosphotransferase (APT) family kinase protein